MATSARLAWLLLPVCAVAACKDDSPPGCQIGQQYPLDSTPLTQAREATLLRAGTGYVLAALDADGATVRWARLGGDGKLGPESALKLPTPRAIRPEPWLALAGKNAPADQLVAVYVVAKAGGANAYELQAITQTAGAEAAAPRTLVDLAAGVDLGVVQISTGSSRSGQRAAVAIGYTGQVVSPTLTVLKADAEPVGMPVPLYAKGEIPAWRCLTVVPARNELMVAAVEPGPSKDDNPNWRLFEHREDGSRSFEAQMNFDTAPDECPIAAPTRGGYVVAYQNKKGTFYSEFDLDKPSSGVNNSLVAGALRFGGPQKQPRVAAVAPMAGEFALLYDRASGHEVYRFNAFGNIQDGPLLLYSTAGMVGPVSVAQGEIDVMHATYLDTSPAAQADKVDGNSSGNRRYLVSVVCPNAIPLPASNRDGGAAADAGK